MERIKSRCILHCNLTFYVIVCHYSTVNICCDSNSNSWLEPGCNVYTTVFGHYQFLCCIWLIRSRKYLDGSAINTITHNYMPFTLPFRRIPAARPVNCRLGILLPLVLLVSLLGLADEILIPEFFLLLT